MISLQKVDNAIKFTFTDSQHYLYGNGTIEVPLNSLLLIEDKSDFVTFKKPDGDVFISAPYAEFGMSKSDLLDWYKNNMVGGAGIPTEEIQQMIDESISGISATTLSAVTDISGWTESSVHGKNIHLKITKGDGSTGKTIIVSSKTDADIVIDSSNYYPEFHLNSAFTSTLITDVDYVGSANTINFLNSSGETIATIDTSDFVIDGMVEDVRIEEISGATYLVIDFNTASGKQDIQIPLTEIFDPSNYYNKSDIDGIVSGLNQSIDAKLDASAYTPTDLSEYWTSAQTESAITNAVSGKQDTLIAGSGIMFFNDITGGKETQELEDTNDPFYIISPYFDCLDYTESYCDFELDDEGIGYEIHLNNEDGTFAVYEDGEETDKWSTYFSMEYVSVGDYHWFLVTPLTTISATDNECTRFISVSDIDMNRTTIKAYTSFIEGEGIAYETDVNYPFYLVPEIGCEGEGYNIGISVDGNDYGINFNADRTYTVSDDGETGVDWHNYFSIIDKPINPYLVVEPLQNLDEVFNNECAYFINADTAIQVSDDTTNIIKELYIGKQDELAEGNGIKIEDETISTIVDNWADGWEKIDSITDFRYVINPSVQSIKIYSTANFSGEIQIEGNGNIILIYEYGIYVNEYGQGYTFEWDSDIMCLTVSSLGNDINAILAVDELYEYGGYIEVIAPNAAPSTVTDALFELRNNKQDTLTAGSGITIEDNVISNDLIGWKDETDTKIDDINNAIDDKEEVISRAIWELKENGGGGNYKAGEGIKFTDWGDNQIGIDAITRLDDVPYSANDLRMDIELSFGEDILIIAPYDEGCQEDEIYTGRVRLYQPDGTGEQGWEFTFSGGVNTHFDVDVFDDSAEGGNELDPDGWQEYVSIMDNSSIIPNSWLLYCANSELLKPLFLGDAGCSRFIQFPKRSFTNDAISDINRRLNFTLVESTDDSKAIAPEIEDLGDNISAYTYTLDVDKHCFVIKGLSGFEEDFNNANPVFFVEVEDADGYSGKATISVNWGDYWNNLNRAFVVGEIDTDLYKILGAFYYRLIVDDYNDIDTLSFYYDFKPIEGTNDDGEILPKVTLTSVKFIYNEIDDEGSALVDGSTFEGNGYFGNIEDAFNEKQDKLVAGSGITIDGNVISATPLVASSAVTSGDTNAVSSDAVYEQLGGLKLQQISQSDYDALVSGGTVDSSTLYVITNVVN